MAPWLWCKLLIGHLSSMSNNRVDPNLFPWYGFGMATNPYQEAARHQKVGKAVEAVTANLGTLSPEYLEAVATAQWDSPIAKGVAALTGGRPFSQASWTMFQRAIAYRAAHKHNGDPFEGL